MRGFLVPKVEWQINHQYIDISYKYLDIGYLATNPINRRNVCCMTPLL